MTPVEFLNLRSRVRLEIPFDLAMALIEIELEILYPRLVEGGILIIDDYGHWEGSKKAVDEYFNKKKWLHSVDYTCRYLIKSKI